MAAPDIAAAQRAADELVSVGAGRVLLFGSVAKGRATERSDIDLVAIYDDLGDYSGRAKRRCALESKASDAAGCPVDVMVTDAPEWAVRTTKVPCSVEARIAGHAVELVDTGRHRGIDWDKEIGLPSNPTGELASRFEDMPNALARLTTNLRPNIDEIDAADEGDDDEHHHLEGVRSAFATLAGSAVDLDNLDQWRQGSTYVDNRPELPSEDSLREHCMAAMNIAAVAADQCRRQGISGRELSRWDRRVWRVSEVLDGPIRHTDDPGISL
ncbi:nucleotidyltransferase domain-containing protein [Candidatus Poriferisodalis sp.]|uniref:nucleotidyltransferase domain-containing protein n=1 Tax=Candidatus Poriferisodalis sp. TaxID=3101277 RepID=UPI003B521D49